MARPEGGPRRRQFRILFLVATSLLAKNVVSWFPHWPNIADLPGSPFRLPCLRVATEYERGTKGTEDGLELRASVTTAGQFIDTHVDESAQEEFLGWLSEQAKQTITKQSHEKYLLAEMMRYYYDWCQVKNLIRLPVTKGLLYQMSPWDRLRTIMGNMPNANEVTFVEFVTKVFKTDPSMMEFVKWLETQFHIDAFSDEKTVWWRYYRLDDLLRNYIEWVNLENIGTENIREPFHFDLDNQKELNLQIGKIMKELLQRIRHEKVFGYWGPLSPPLANSAHAEDTIQLSKKSAQDHSYSLKFSKEPPSGISSSSLQDGLLTGSSSIPRVAVWHYAQPPDICPYGTSEKYLDEILEKINPEVKSQLNEHLVIKANEECATVPQNICTETLDEWVKEFKDKNQQSSPLFHKLLNGLTNFLAPQK